MYKEIMETDAGREFEKWLEFNSVFCYNFVYDEFFCDIAEDYMLINESIINNLAIEFLDSKEIYVNVFKCRDAFYITVRDERGFDIPHEYSSFGCDTRQEAIEQGVRKSFELLGL